jgi:hypothetical protein
MAKQRKPSFVMLLVRVVVITVLATLLAFCVSLFLGILGIMLFDLIASGGINLANAYKHVALPAAAVALVVAFCAALITEIQYYSRARAAAASAVVDEA